jgi:hypothetical protein
MSKPFTPIVIAKHEQKEKDFTIAIETKKNRFNALFEYLQQYVSIENKETYKGQIYSEFISSFNNKHFANYPTLKIEKIADLHDCRLHQVEALIDAFESIDIDWNFTTNEPESIPCFDIKTEYAEQNDRYQKTNKLIDALDDIRDTRHLYLADIVRGLNGIVAYDFHTQKIVPNLAYVLGEKERATY